MNRQSGINAKRIISRILFSMIITSFASTIYAQTDSTADSLREQYNIKYLGAEGNMQVFSMQLDLSQGDKYMVEIKENQNNTLFKQLYRDQKITKTFKIPRDVENVSFVIRNLKNNTIQAYAVSSIVQVYDEVVVRKIN